MAKKLNEEQKALIRAVLEGKTLQYTTVGAEATFGGASYVNLPDEAEAITFVVGGCHVVRVKPDVIVVNGIEVPAPEKEKPALGDSYFVPNINDSVLYDVFEWDGGTLDQRLLSRGLIHTSRDSAIAHANAMLAHKPG